LCGRAILVINISLYCHLPGEKENPFATSHPDHHCRIMPPPSSSTATATSVQVGTYHAVSGVACPMGAVAHARCRCLQRCGFDRRRRKIRTRSPSDSNEQSYTPPGITRSRSKQRAVHPAREHLASPPPHQKSRILISTKFTTQTRHSTRYLPPQPSRSSPASWRVSTAQSSPMARPRAGRRTP